ncbi:hypothetical protein MPSEU_000778100 [Mayamaea pseudoterrestris]|nr:hypothetical protein MPSEU_000778100 [Mayamaea pseudoterrestris]
MNHNLSGSNDDQRKRRNVVSDADMAELERHYRFVPSKQPSTATAFSEPSKEQRGTWQDRMVQHYHQHLYKEYVLADLTFASEQRLGLRWRTQDEVASGKGSTSCGNKHCPSHKGQFNETKLHAAIVKVKPIGIDEELERKRLMKLDYGDDQVDYEVPFSYQEQGESKLELVKLRLCAKCAPLLFISHNKADPCLAACKNTAVATSLPVQTQSSFNGKLESTTTAPAERERKKRQRKRFKHS